MSSTTYKHVISLLVVALVFPLSSLCQTSWRGTSSTSWNLSANWTAGVPTASVDAVIGDANFTGPYQPSISSNAAVRNLTIGPTGSPVLTLTKNLTVAGNLEIQAGGTITQRGVTITIRGNWTNGGTYSATHNNSRVTFGGAAQSIGGSVPTPFRRLGVSAGSTVTLNSNISVSGSLTVTGTLIPAENATPYTISGAGALTVEATGVLHVTAPTYLNNYGLTGFTALNGGSVVAYSATLINQTIRPTLTYSTLRISGASRIKTPSGNLNALNSSSSAAGRIEVLSGILDLSTFTANRGTSVAGGALVVANGAVLRVGGANNFPANFSTRELRLGSTVEYNGGNQAVSAQTYGNLLLTGGSGTVTKTMPSAAFTVEGNFVSTQGTATAVSFTAASDIRVNGNVSIGTATTFNGGSFTHEVAGDWTVTGVFNGNSSTVEMTGGGSLISGSGTHGFNNLTIAGSNITAAAIPITVAGDLADVEPGSFTHALGGTITMTGASKTISGPDFILDNLVIAGSVSSASTVELRGNFTVNGSFNGNGGEIDMTGTGKTLSGTGTIAFGILGVTGTVTTAASFAVSNSLDVSGSFTATAGTATFTGSSSLNGTTNLFNVTVNGTSFQLSSNAIMGVSNAFSVTAGTFDITTSVPNTVNYNGAAAQTVRAGAYNNLTLSGAGTKTAGGAITVNGDVSIASGSTFAGSSFTHTLLGNWMNAGSYTAGSGTVILSGASNASISGATTFNTLTINKSVATVEVGLLNNIRAATVGMTSGRMQTGANTLTITGSRTGPGIIMGNIQRLHAFAPGTAYAFESPANTITLTGANTLSSITVSVVSQSIGDFPSGGSVNREYTISSAGLLNASLITLRMHYEDDELNGNVESNMGLWRNTGTGWNAVGKTANSTTANYVEQSGLSTMNGRWTFSDDANIVRWNGAVSSDWATAANWTSVQGTPATPPGPADIVEIGTVAFANQPVISNVVSVKSITLGSVQPVTLSLAAGGGLTSLGNIAGTWSANAVHTINVNNQSMTVTGDLALSNGVDGRAINLNVGAGSVVVTGVLTQSGGANINCTGAATLAIGGNYNYTNGTFTAGSGTVNYNGTGTQAVAPLTYNNLTIQKNSGTATVGAATAVNGQLSVNAGTLTLNAATTVAGNVAIGTGAILNGSNSGISVGGNWVNSGTFSPSGSTVSFNGTGAQSISASAFNNVTVNKPSGTATLTGNLGIAGSLSLSAGTLDLSTFTAHRATLGGTMSLAAGTTLLIGGALGFPANYSVYTLNNSSTVHYNGSIAQTVTGGRTYGNLVFSNGGGNAKTLSATSIVNGNVTINSGASFNGGAFTLNVFGNWVNNGTFIPSTGTVTFNGAGRTITGNTVFNRVTIFGSYTVTGSDITYNGLLLIATGGSFDAGGGLATVTGDLTNSGSLVSNGVTTFTGTSLQTIRFVNAVVSNSSGVINFNGNVSPVLNSTSSPSYATLNINNTAGVTASVGWNVFVAFNISSGASFHGGGSSHNIFGSFTNNGVVTSNGELNFLPAVARTIQLSGSGFTSTGTVQFGGTGAMSVTGSPSALSTVVISNSAGVTPSANWNIGSDFQLTSTGVFNAGSFAFNVGGNIESNGTLNGGTSTFTMSAPSGIISGSPGTTFYDFIVTGNITAESDFQVSRNFSNNGTSTSFTASPGTLTMTGTGTSVIGGTPTSYTLANLEVNKAPDAVVTLARNLTEVASLSISGGTLDLSTFTVTQEAGAGELGIENNARLVIRGNNTLPAFTTYELDTFSTVEYAGGTQAISSAAPYGNLTISAAGTKTAAAILRILNNFSLSNGTFVPGSFADTIGGNWSMTSGTFTNTGSTMVFAGTGTQQVVSTGAFNNFTVNKPSGFIDLSSNITINGILNFISRNIRTGNNTVIMPASGSVTNAGQARGWVFGNLQKQVVTGSNVSRVFEIGDSLNYTPASTVFASVSAAGSLVAATISTDHPAIASSGLDAQKSINRYWTFTGSGTTFTTASVTLNWVAGDMDAGIVPANLRAGSYNGTTWTLPAVTSPASTSITTTGLTSLQSLVAGELVSAINWTGAISSSWFVTGNWSGGTIPGTLSNVVIPSGLVNYPVISSGTAATRDLSIQASASVTVSGGLLQISGNIANSGTFTASDGSIEFNGTTAQTIPAGVFAGNSLRDLAVNNAAGVTIAGTLNINGILKVTTGQLNTGGYLTLTSTAARTALIDGSGSGSVLGNVTMQRYLPSGFGYKYFSSPFQAATVNEFANEIDLGASFPLFYRYEQNRASSGWVAYTNPANPLVPMLGYAANISGAQGAVTVDMTGVVNNNTQSVTLFNHNQPYTLGFNLAGNPYPSPVDWDITAGWSRTNIDDAVYYFNAGAEDRYTGTYSSYINGVSSNGIASNIIPAMQGFFVHVSDGAYPVTGSLGINNAARINDLAPVFHREYPNTSPLLRLSAGFADEGLAADPVVIYFEDGASKDFDRDRDALKMLNTDPLVPNLFTETAASEPLSICAWPARVDSLDSIPLRLLTERAGMISLRTVSMERMPSGLHIYLHDAATGTTAELYEGFRHRLQLGAGDYKERFYLVFRRNESDPGPAGDAMFHAYSVKGELFAHFDRVPGEQCSVSVTGMQGQVLFRKELTGNGRHSLGSQYSSGLYIVSFHTAQQVVSKKVFIHK